MTLKQILERGLEKYAEQPAATASTFGAATKPLAPSTPLVPKPTGTFGVKTPNSSAQPAASPAQSTPQGSLHVTPAMAARHAFRQGYYGRTEGMPDLVTGKTMTPQEAFAQPGAQPQVRDFDPMETPWAPKLDPNNPDAAMQAGQREWLREYGYRTGQMPRPAEQQAWVDNWIQNGGQPQPQPTPAPATAQAPAAPPTANPAAAAGTTQNPQQQQQPASGVNLNDPFDDNVSQPAAAAVSPPPAPAQTPATPIQQAAGTQTQTLPAPGPAAEAGTTQNPQQQQQPAASPKPLDQQTAKLEEVKRTGTPEQQAAAQQETVAATVEQLAPTLTDETKQQVEGHLSGDQKATDAGRDKFVTDQAGGDPAKTQDPTWYGQAMGMWDNMGPMGQAAFMIGVPAALIGLLSGDGLMGILGGLGIGALGIGAGAMGMMGEQTQAGMGRMLGDLAENVGLVSPAARDSSVFAPGSEDQTRERISGILREKGPEAAQQALNEERAKFDQLRGLHGMNPELAHSYMMGMRGEYAPKTREEAAALYDRLNKQYEATGQQDYLYEQTLASPEPAQIAAAEQAERAPDWARNALRGVRDWGRARGLGGYVPESWRSNVNDLVDPAEQVAERRVKAMFKKSYVVNDIVLAAIQRQQAKNLVKSATRCWAGYEPVPGAKAYSRGSCRPVGSKKTQKEMKSGKERHHATTKQSGAEG